MEIKNNLSKIKIKLEGDLSTLDWNAVQCLGQKYGLPLNMGGQCTPSAKELVHCL